MSTVQDFYKLLEFKVWSTVFIKKKEPPAQNMVIICDSTADKWLLTSKETTKRVPKKLCISKVRNSNWQILQNNSAKKFSG